MKLTKSKLKQIIKEELEEIIGEKKEHPGETCEQAHPDETHEEWEEEPLRVGTPKEDPWKLKKRLGIGGSVHDRLKGPRLREDK